MRSFESVAATSAPKSDTFAGAVDHTPTPEPAGRAFQNSMTAGTSSLRYAAASAALVSITRATSSGRVSRSTLTTLRFFPPSERTISSGLRSSTGRAFFV